jgi:hypothetical protein
MPTSPDAPPPEVVKWFNFFFPTSQFLAAFAVVVSIWLSVLVIRWGLKLVKML